MDIQLSKNKQQAPAPRLELRTDVGRLGEHGDAILKIVEKAFVEIVGNGEDRENGEADVFRDQDLEQRVSLDVKRQLDLKLGGNWTTIAGKRFSISVALAPGDCYGLVRWRDLHLTLFKCSLMQ